MRTKRAFPTLWPWSGTDSIRLDLLQAIASRPFSAFYVSITTAIMLLIGLGDARICDTAARALICDAAIWPAKLFSEPHEFVLSWFTAPWFVHSIDQAIFVTLGFLIFVQSYEFRAGSRNAILLFLGGTVVASTSVAIGLNLGHIWHPDSEVINDGLARNWMGGSVAFYTAIGGLSHFASKPWVMPVITIAFEAWNHFFNDISLPTSSAHMIGLTFGLVMGCFLHPRGEFGAADAAHSISTEPSSSAMLPR